MIEKIRNMIEDTTGMDVTKNQILMGFAVIATLLILIVIIFIQSGGPKNDPAGQAPNAMDFTQKYYQR